ncbi:head-tail connector protein [Thioclava sp. GXIMD2076]|uniref:head-tail connector protein n=1 Tax=Thioclava sp. GXIMD2076 TaxID=3131931 RepID=UPI0030CE2012
MSVDLADVKSFCQIDFTDRDVEIQGHLSTALTFVADYLRRDMDADYPDGWPDPCKQSVRLLVWHWLFGKAEADVGMPPTVKSLLAQYRDLS